MTVVIRPLLLSLLGAVIINYIILLATKDWAKASLYTAAILILFFVHGHIVRALVDSLDIAKKESIEGASYAGVTVIAALMFYFISKARSSLMIWVNMLNTMSIVLILLPIMQISAVKIKSVNGPQLSTETYSENTPSQNQRPDIYYIILDGYSRADTLEVLGYDNSKFLRQLEEIGFYIATCSTSNYKATALSMPAALNMDYLWDAIPNTGDKDINVSLLYDSLVHNRVRNELEQRGYKTISFQTGYQWDEWTDADLYIIPTNEYTADEIKRFPITPFEYLYLRNTILYSFIESGRFATQRYYEHYNRVIFTLEELPNIASIPGPKFVYAHIMTPHNPFVFLPDGSLNTDSRYYDSEKGYPSNSELFTPGYLNSIQFLNSRLPGIIDEIIKNSGTPPVIVLQGDHGYIIPERRYNILNAYYLPGQEYDGLLYPSITPVNTFRIIFNQYFDMNMELRDDLMIRADIGGPYRQGRSKPFPESCP
ncbi:MAG TPA: hypothetical protein VK851_02395 [Anaerolineales bacterium]|nr:hypothetical protein [Anaerolineales bacterium]